MSEQGEQSPSGGGIPGGFVASDTAEVKAVAAPVSPVSPVKHHGRPISWVAISLVIVGFMVGAVAMIFGTGGPMWPVFWTGAGIAVLGLLITVATNTFADWY